MTIPKITGVELAGDASKPLLVVGPSLGAAVTALWSGAATVLGEHFHVVGWDLPGHGSTPAGDAFTMKDLAAGVLAFVDGARRARDDQRPFAYAGVSAGGAIGLQMMLDAPTEIRAAALLCTGAQIGTADGWHERAATVRASGTPSMVTGSVQRWFAPGFLQRDPATSSALLESLQHADAEGYAQVCEALADFDVRDRLADITTPVLAVAGAQDDPTPPASLQAIAAGVAEGRVVILDDVAHLAPAEAPDRVARLLRDHLLPSPTMREVYDAGMMVRREVLGDAHVDRATATTTPFTEDFQELITQYAWGTIWTRPGLDRRSRSMITLTALIARGHHEELAMHVRAAVNNGLTADEIKEVILQSAIYTGVPDANTAFQIAHDTLANRH
ncbi:4-carboxymuconolactone decarboxylase [Nocardioides sp. LMS-CY]|uniref:bifunctional 3-oxoadipate enol-lactonase/4-carboxymuconolactone decarboxylase PcaDC n=1 Tax=Nocardioides sp. (strain LMS-CY) TaxID=2840457 RepID=UPI001C000C92|nr:4-carboxymuconolactone decarboxylase [Nocardioides sp. LMS-CY]QWF22325.1 4-carboxymuconolactone decarboxylase [Nocardioides sp. LMS-CY]